MNGETLTFRKPTLISEGKVLPWKVRMMVAVVILFPSFVIIIFCASLTLFSLRLSTMSSMAVNFSSLHRMTPLMVFRVLWGDILTGTLTSNDVFMRFL